MSAVQLFHGEFCKENASVPGIVAITVWLECIGRLLMLLSIKSTQ